MKESSAEQPVAPTFHIDAILRMTIDRDPNLNDAEKMFFSELSADELDWDKTYPAKQAAELFSTLLRKNYVWIDGWPPAAVQQNVGRVRHSLRLIGRALRNLFTGKEQA